MLRSLCYMLLLYRFEKEREEITDLLFPPWPVMVDVKAPVVEPGIYTFLLEYPVKKTLRIETVFPGALPYTEDDLFLIVDIDIGMSQRKVRHIRFRAVVIQNIIHPSAEEICGVVNTRHRKHAGKQVRPSQKSVCRVIGSHAAPGAEWKDA